MDTWTRWGLRFWVCAAMSLAVVGANAADAAAPGATVLSRAAFELPPFEQLPKASFGAVSATAYGRIRQVAQGRLERVSYLSQSHRVTALVLPAAGARTTRAPVVVYCRGGVGPSAAISLATPFHLYEMSRYAEAGYFVIAPQYRGADGGEGRDEVGGADVNDVLALAGLLAGFEQADANQIFLIGASRGGMMALAAARAGFPARGVVANGVPADWELAFSHNARLRQLALEHWPDYQTDPEGAIKRRSAARWAQEIPVPVLLQHGGADAIVHPSVALDFARRLGEHGKPYDLAIYAGDDHPIANHFEERLARAIGWMRSLAPPRVVSVVAEDFKLAVPERLAAGRNAFVFENRGREPHYFRLMRFAEDKGMDDFVAWRRSRTSLPPWLIPAGGAGTLAPGERTEYAVSLAAGRYVVFCGHPGADGVPHVDKGMYTVLRVDESAGAATSREPDVTIELGDQRMTVTPRFRQGSQNAYIRNTGARSHQALLILLPQGVTAEQELAWFRGGSRGPRPGHPMGGAIEVAPGGEAWAGFELRPGRYLLICSVVDPAGARHFDHGMQHAFEIA